MCLGWEGLASALFSNWPSAQPNQGWACLVPREPTQIGRFSGTHHERDAVCIPQILGATFMAPKSQILKSFDSKTRACSQAFGTSLCHQTPRGELLARGLPHSLCLSFPNTKKKSVNTVCLFPVRTNTCEIITANHKVYLARLYEWSSDLWPQRSGGWGRRQKVLRNPGLYSEQAGLGYTMVAVLKRRK